MFALRKHSCIQVVHCKCQMQYRWFRALIPLIPLIPIFVHTLQTPLCVRQMKSKMWKKDENEKKYSFCLLTWWRSNTMMWIHKWCQFRAMVIGRHEQVTLIFIRWIAGRRLCGGCQSLKIEFVCVPLSMHFCHYIFVVVVPAPKQQQINTQRLFYYIRVSLFLWIFRIRSVAISFKVQLSNNLTTIQ